MSKNKAKPVVLIVMDGFGLGKPNSGNAIFLAKPKNFNNYWKTYPRTSLNCIGKFVGLSGKTQGNSEVGHLHLGAGKIVWQPMELIDRAIQNKQFYKNKAFLKVIQNVKKHKTQLHLMGLCSNQGVHAQLQHLFELIKLAKKHKLKKVFIHCFLDGRDVPERSAIKYVQQIQTECNKLKIGKIASLIGRYYAMDRDQNWERTQTAYELITQGKGKPIQDPIQGIQTIYQEGNETDYYIEPLVVVEQTGKSVSIIQENDGVIFFNFRTDRARQLTQAVTDSKFDKFKRKKIPVTFVSMTEYNPKFKTLIAFPQEKIKTNLGKIISQHRLTQLRIAETEKYAHVTFFFNSQTEKPSKGEHRILIPSPKVKSYDLKPEMSAYRIKDTLIQELEKNKYDFVLINFANPDLVGHSGKLNATIKAVQVVDECIGKIVEKVLEKNGIVLLTADHGNAEEMVYSNGLPKPSHTQNKVPCILISNKPNWKKIKLKKNAEIKDITPTILELLKLKKPKEMTGKSLIQNHKQN
ncbi:MAG: 2,3-bisphosphoglycerate-independent phosphoglycerate mutase [Candidatus Diapherotrites archaeon]|nr:2,3-bisphosphoglycerate-independent phosphoglycerate mutase [Candidatus Diapherotrites archaeon]